MSVQRLQVSSLSERQLESALRDIGNLQAQLNGHGERIKAFDLIRVALANHLLIEFIEQTKGPEGLLSYTDHIIRGMGVLAVVEKLNGRIGVIEDVVVAEEYRGQGIARQLMEAIRMEARRLGLHSLHLTSHPRREAANHLYQKLGYQLVETNKYRLNLS